MDGVRTFAEEDNDTPFAVIDATIVKMTKNAVLIRAPRFEVDIWIPQSVVHDDSEVFDDKHAGPGKLCVKTWYAEKRGWLK